jgi:hypothetical protein
LNYRAEKYKGVYTKNSSTADLRTLVRNFIAVHFTWAVNIRYIILTEVTGAIYLYCSNTLPLAHAGAGVEEGFMSHGRLAHADNTGPDIPIEITMETRFLSPHTPC